MQALHRLSPSKVPLKNQEDLSLGFRVKVISEEDKTITAIFTCSKGDWQASCWPSPAQQRKELLLDTFPSSSSKPSLNFLQLPSVEWESYKNFIGYHYTWIDFICNCRSPHRRSDSSCLPLDEKAFFEDLQQPAYEELHQCMLGLFAPLLIQANAYVKDLAKKIQCSEEDQVDLMKWIDYVLPSDGIGQKMSDLPLELRKKSYDHLKDSMKALNHHFRLLLRTMEVSARIKRCDRKIEIEKNLYKSMDEKLAYSRTYRIDLNQQLSPIRYINFTRKVSPNEDRVLLQIFRSGSVILFDENKKRVMITFPSHKHDFQPIVIQSSSGECKGFVIETGLHFVDDPFKKSVSDPSGSYAEPISLQSTCVKKTDLIFQRAEEFKNQYNEWIYSWRKGKLSEGYPLTNRIDQIIRIETIPETFPITDDLAD